MPRQARLDTPGALHYIIVRGIDKTVIFREDWDKIKFLEKMGAAVTWRNSDYHVPNSPVISAYAPRAYLGLLQRQVVKPVVKTVLVVFTAM